MFDVTCTVTAKVPAINAGQAVEIVSEYIRQGLGREGNRRYEAAIIHAQATTKSVFIPERRE